MSLSASREKRLLFTLALIHFVHILDFMVMMPLGPHFIRDFAINAGLFSFLISAYTVSAGVAGFIGSFFLDKVERKKTLVLSLSGFTVGTLFCALSPTYIILFVSRIITGFFGGILASLVLAILGDVIPSHRRGNAMGMVMSSFSIASIVGVPCGLFLSNIWSWTAPFYLLFGTGLITILLAIKTVPSCNLHLEEDNNTELAIVKVFKNKNLRSSLALTLSIMLGQFAVVPLISTYMVTNVGFTAHNLTYVYIFGGLAAMIMSPISGKLGDRFGKFPVFMIFSILCMIPLLVITQLGLYSSLVIPLIFTSLLFLCSTGRMVCGMALIISSVGSKQRGGFMSINTSVQQLSAGAASFIGGIIIHQLPSGKIINYDYVGYWAVSFAILSIIAASRVKQVESN
ncbi:MFS transporter [bacterium]|jgi:predicted MFS family arabinose efflux permease|nr:MFS transporter [bacterium]